MLFYWPIILFLDALDLCLLCFESCPIILNYAFKIHIRV